MKKEIDIPREKNGTFKKGFISPFKKQRKPYKKCDYCNKIVPWPKKDKNSTFSEKRYAVKKFCNLSCRYKKWKGIGSPSWKKKLTYTGIHAWVVRELGKPHFCEHCGNRKLNHRQYQWANMDNTYKRKLSDWVRLCTKCHSDYDRPVRFIKWKKAVEKLGWNVTIKK